MLEKLQAKSRVKNMMLFFPQMVGLCGRLLMDDRVSKTEKALFASALVYAIAPLDFLPDFLPFIGQVDDAYLVALTLLRLVNRTDASIVRQHWRGGGDIVELASSITALAPKLLPKRVSRVISANIDFAPLIKRHKVLKAEEAKADKNEDADKPVMRVV